MGQGSEEERHQLTNNTVQHKHRKGTLAPLFERLERQPVCADDDLGNRHLQDLIEKLEHKDLMSVFEQQCEQAPHLRAFIKGIMVNAPFLREIILRDASRFLRILGTPPEETVSALLHNCLTARPTSEAELMQSLRLAKQELALTVALADIAGAWHLESVTGALTRFADASLTASLRFCLRELEARGKFDPVDPEKPEKEAGFFILAMGKHGAGELNYSSDIDLIVLYDPERCRLTGGAEAPVEFVRITRRMVKLMNERTGDGYVFRTDLRLRRIREQHHWQSPFLRRWSTMKAWDRIGNAPPSSRPALVQAISKLANFFLKRFARSSGASIWTMQPSRTCTPSNVRSTPTKASAKLPSQATT